MQLGSGADTFATGLRHYWRQLSEGAAACWFAAVFAGEFFMLNFIQLMQTQLLYTLLIHFFII